MVTKEILKEILKKYKVKHIAFQDIEIYTVLYFSLLCYVHSAVNFIRI